MSQQKTKFIENQAVSNSKLSNVSTQTIKGRTTAGSGSPEDLTATQATAILNGVVGDSGSGGTKGLVPAPAALDAVSNKVLHADGTFRQPIDVSKVFVLYEDFQGGISNSASGGLSNGYFSSTSSGAGSTFAVTSTFLTDNAQGIFGVGTGTTNTGRGSGVAGFIKLGGGYTIFKANVNFTALYDGTDQYIFDIGLHDAFTSGSPANGIYFEYDGATSANWRVKTTNASTTTTTTSSTAVIGAGSGNWQQLMFVVNSDNTEVKFYVNNSLIATHTTNISADVVKPVIRTSKTAGTTSRSALIDYMFVQIAFNTAR